MNNFYEKNNINYLKLKNILNIVDFINIKYSDIYIQLHDSNILTLENKIIKNNYNNSFNGISLRCISDNITSLFSLNDIKNYKYFIDKIYLIKDIFKKNNKNNKKKCFYIKNIFNNINNKYFNNRKNLLEKKIFLLNKIYKIIKKNNNKIKEIKISLLDLNDKICILNKYNSNIDTRILIELKIFLVIEINKKFSSGYSSIITRYNLDELNNKVKNSEFTYIETCIYEAINMALSNLNAKDSPSGIMPVVLGSGVSGVLLHEAIGHGLESDFIVNKTSIFYNKIKKKVASEYCTVIDDGSMKNTNGYINMDDEGTPGKYNVLIDKGILKSFIYDKYNANILNTESTGNGRRESYSKNIIPRMTNTYLLPGNHSFENIINSIDYGIYATNFTDGQVDITSGKFVFSTSVAFLIKNGLIKYPIKKITLIGSNIEIMNNISMIGNDFKMDLGSSTCIKDNQSIPVSVGQPTIKIENITVGGTK